ncbi:MAG: hypothetical protein ACI4R9_02380 [Kiritimatiellia bacterium]
MKRATFILSMVLLLGGCLSSAPKAPVNWTIEARATQLTPAPQPKWGAVRLAQVAVRAPYDGQKLAVLRPNGSIAFDSFNTFAAAPAALLRGAAHDVAEGSALFTRVLHASSSAAAPYALEVAVTQLALDCRREKMREARCELTVLLLRGREVVGSARGAASRPMVMGDFSAAFSMAFTSALADALNGLGH